MKNSIVKKSGYKLLDANSAIRLPARQKTALQLLCSGVSVASAARAMLLDRTIHRWLRSDPAFQAAFNQWHNEVDECCRARLSLLMTEAQFGAALQFPAMRLNAGELAQLAPGMVLRLPLARHSGAELRVGGLPIFQALPVRTGDRRGAQVKGHTVEAERPVVQ